MNNQSNLAERMQPEEDSVQSLIGDTLMLGTSPGIRHIHDPIALPFDTVTYLLRAEVERRRLGLAKGILFAVDRRSDGDISDHAEVQSRTERLRQLLKILLPHFRMRTHTELEASGLRSTLEQVLPNSNIEDEELRRYSRFQTAQVLHMKAQARNGVPHRFVKFGWILSRRGSGTPVGGEANFDPLLPADGGIECAYTAPGFPLDSHNGKAPYLLHISDRAKRICLPQRIEEVAPEIAKIKEGMSRVVHDTLRATAETVLGLRSEVHSPDSELSALPISKAMKQPITDSHSIAELRELLNASLNQLIL